MNMTAPENWPSEVMYLTRPVHSSNLRPEQLKALHTQPINPTPGVSLSSSNGQANINIVRIENVSHPANGQLGLFARTDLPPDSLVTPYLGLVYSMDNPEDQERVLKSNYDIAQDRELRVGVDAGEMGNHGRCVNDYRGVPQQRRTNAKGDKAEPNAEFRDIWMEWTEDEPQQDEEGSVCDDSNAILKTDERPLDPDTVDSQRRKRVGKRKKKRRERGIGVFVLGAGKSGKRKGGIKAGEEILVSYGKGFWHGRE